MKKTTDTICRVTCVPTHVDINTYIQTTSRKAKVIY